MPLKIWRFATIMLVAVALSAGLAHVMELPPKMGYEADLYVMLHRTLYPNFGHFAGVAEFLAVIGSGVLAWRLHRQRLPSLPTAIGAVLLAIAHAVFWIWVQPANTTIASWPLEQIPADWARWRDRWEYAHAVRALLILTALAALVISVLRGMPASGAGTRSSRRE